MLQWDLIDNSWPEALKHAPTVQAKKPRTVAKCDFCREKKQRCSYTKGPWPSQCDRCRQKGLPCSEPQLAPKTRSLKNLTKVSGIVNQFPSPQVSQATARISKPLYTPNNTFTSPRLEQLPTANDANSKEAILLLSLHALLSMALQETIEIAVDMFQPPRRNPEREQTEEKIPVLQAAIHEFKTLLHAVKARMLSVGDGKTFCHAQEALSSLATPSFHQSLTWGIDEVSIGEVRASVASFHELGHPGLAYVMYIKLLQNGGILTQDDERRLMACKDLFAEDLKSLFREGHLDNTSHLLECQLFTPRKLVRRVIFAQAILRDDRPDYLGRSSSHILADADIPVRWSSSCAEQPWKALRFECPSLFLVSNRQNPQNINRADILHRTALHIAVRQRHISSVMTLSMVGADMHRTCLHGLTLLHIAACHGHTDMLQRLVENPHYHHTLAWLDDLYRTPYWYAARGSHLDLIDHLTSPTMANQINMEHEDIYGHSPLAIAARDGCAKALNHLLQLRNTIRNISSTSPLPSNEHLVYVYAIQSKNSRCIELVRKHRKWKHGDETWRRAMQYAISHNDGALQTELQDLYKYDIQSPTGNTSGTVQDVSGQVHFATDLSVLTSSGPWLGLMQSNPNWSQGVGPSLLS